MKLGEKIQLLRKKRGWSQEELANVLNVSRQSVQKWETDSSTPEVDKLVQISDIFGVTLDYLLKNNDVEENKEVKQETTVTPKTENVFEPVKTIIYEENGMEESRITACKVWLIIGAVLTPLSAGGSFLSSVQSPFALLFLLLYAVTIPLCCFAIKAIKTAKNKNDVIGWGVVSLVFVSLIGGILILSARFKTRKKEVTATNNAESNMIVSDSPNVISSEESLEETKYSLLQKHIYEYETQKSIGDLREIVTISKFLSDKGYKDSVDIYKKYKQILEEREKKREASAKKGLKIGVAIFAVVAILTGIIVPVSISTANANRKKHYDEVYSEVLTLLNNYDDDNYYRIRSLINELPYGEGYDTSALWSDLNGKHNYEELVTAIGSFNSTRSYTLSEIKKLINSSKENYKQINAIKSDYDKVDSYTSTISTNTSTSACNYTSDGTAETNRNAISYMYSYANNSGLWNFDYYVKYLSAPYLVCGAQFSYGSYYFKWYKDSSGGHLTWSVPVPSTYDSSKTYYFDTSFTGAGYKSSTSNERYTNQLKFYLKLKTGSSSYSYIDLFRIEEISYKKSTGRFNCKVYLFGNGSTVTFTQD